METIRETNINEWNILFRFILSPKSLNIFKISLSVGMLRSIEERFTSFDDKFKGQFEKEKPVLEHTMIICFGLKGQNRGST